MSLFITLEGIEGSGKSTQIRLLADHLRARGITPLVTREPGGTAIGDEIRKILLTPESAHIDPVAELMLYEAARCQHVREVIIPALERGELVLCDRYADATAAYQGAARNIDRETIGMLHTIATGGLWPDLTLLIDCPVAWGLAHANRRNRELNLTGSEDRFEREESEFHERVRRGYLDIARREPNRVKVIDAARTIEDVHKDIATIVEKALTPCGTAS